MALFAACASTPKPPPLGTAPPVIDDAWASPTASWGDIWRVYVKAHDPDGDLYAVHFDLDRPGVLTPPFWGYNRLPEEMQTGFDGYFYLQMPWHRWFIGNQDMTVTLRLEDRGERYSRTVSFPLRLGTTPQKEPPARFTDRALLPVSQREFPGVYGDGPFGGLGGRSWAETERRPFLIWSPGFRR